MMYMKLKWKPVKLECESKTEKAHNALPVRVSSSCSVLVVLRCCIFGGGGFSGAFWLTLSPLQPGNQLR